MKKIVNFLLFALSMTVVNACKVYQNRSRDEQQSFRADRLHLQHRQRQQEWQRDSVSRYWLFWSDSLFRFHPETGLSGTAGTVLMQESRQSTQMLNKIVDSRQELEAQSTQKSKREKSNWERLTTLWGAGLILLLIFIGWHYRKFFKW